MCALSGRPQSDNNKPHTRAQSDPGSLQSPQPVLRRDQMDFEQECVTPVLFALPKGRQEKAVLALLNEAGISVKDHERCYRPTLSLPGFRVKMLRSRNIVEMLHLGTRDLGFAGRDWVMELGADLVELLDTGFDPVRIVAAAPQVNVERLKGGGGLGEFTVVASEYERLTKAWMEEKGMNARFMRSYGATEVFPPEDADCIVDNVSSGDTMRANGLVIFDQLMTSSTRLYASHAAMADPVKAPLIENLIMLFRSVLEARRRVMIEVNVDGDTSLDRVVEILPCMREATVSRLHGKVGYAVKAAVPRDLLAGLIPKIKARGGTDIVVSPISQIVM